MSATLTDAIKDQFIALTRALDALHDPDITRSQAALYERRINRQWRSLESQIGRSVPTQLAESWDWELEEKTGKKHSDRFQESDSPPWEDECDTL